MGASQRRKGAEGERELARMLRDELGDVARNLQQTASGGHDLLGVYPFALEVKRAKQPKIATWWRQACEQAAPVRLSPALAYRLDKQEWRVIVPLCDIAPLIYGQWGHDLQYTAALSVPGFCTVVRESQDRR